MTLLSGTLWDPRDKIAIAIARLRDFEPPEGYYLAFSGGKDSQVVYHLAQEAGVKFDAHFSVTTVDPPEVLRFIREQYPDVLWERPEKGMYRLIVENGMPPTRIQRYCCRMLKENGGKGRVVLTGIRWAEGVQRKSRGMFERCLRDRSKTYLHAIIDWSEDDVWAYHRLCQLPHVCLYDEGFSRVGCIMCPMAVGWRKKRDAERWPSFAAMYQRACGAAYAKREARHDTLCWTSGADMYNWWVNEPDKEDEQQLGLFT